jgi:single-strand selective monofunctional uracil DNA glycosylase
VARRPRALHRAAEAAADLAAAATAERATGEALVAAARALSLALRSMRPIAPVTHIYNPLDYAIAVYGAYCRRFGHGRKRVVFVGMNPGPWGMTQTGVPFGEVAIVRDWLGLHGDVGRPADMHPKRPVQGWDCPRSEVSGKRLWGGFASRFGTPEAFFAEHWVMGYCPLAFMEASGRNFTPDHLDAAQRAALEAPCDHHLRAVVDILAVEWVIGIGAYGEAQARRALEGKRVRIGRILHPSPASPLAQKGWMAQATASLVALGVWPAA